MSRHAYLYTDASLVFYLFKYVCKNEVISHKSLSHTHLVGPF